MARSFITSTSFKKPQIYPRTSPSSRHTPRRRSTPSTNASIFVAALCLFLLFSDVSLHPLYALGVTSLFIRDHTLDCTQRVQLTRGSAPLCAPRERHLWRGRPVYSAGIGDDARWEARLVARYGASVWGWDPTPLTSQLAPTRGMRLQRVGLAAQSGNLTLRVPFGSRRSYAVAARPGELGPSVNVPVLSLHDMMQALRHVHLAVLKMDIEGEEFAVIDAWWRANAGVPADQVVVEFHERYFDWMPGHRKLVRRSVAKMRELGFRVVGSKGTEVTFARLMAVGIGLEAEDSLDSGEEVAD